jgi:hypothetical protein
LSVQIEVDAEKRSGELSMKIKIPNYLKLILVSIVLLCMADACADPVELEIFVSNESSYTVAVRLSEGGSNILSPGSGGRVYLDRKAPSFFILAKITDGWLEWAKNRREDLTTQYEAAIAEKNPENAAKILVQLKEISAKLTTLESSANRTRSCTGVTVEGEKGNVTIRDGIESGTISITCTASN